MATTQFTNIEYSDALPIQLWPADCSTWNEAGPEGMMHPLFCQPINCDDTIRIEFTDNLSDDLNFETITLPALSTWLNHDTGDTAWSVGGATPSVSLPSSFPLPGSSDVIYFPYDFIPSYKYIITVQIQHTTTGSGQLRVYDSDFNTIAGMNQSFVLINGIRTVQLQFTATEETAMIGINVVGVASTASTATILTRAGQRTVPDAYQITIQDDEYANIVTIDLTKTVIDGTIVSKAYYYKSFRMSDYGICDQKVIIRIYKSTGTPDIEVLKSDGLDVRTSHAETVLITYSNHRNYSGLYYQSLSPDQEFSIRIPARFAKQRFPQSQESLQLSSNKVIALNAQVKFQKWLETGKMPYYMHLKMVQVLQHQLISIQSEYWVNEDGYQQVEATNPRDPFEKYTCYLTKKDYVVRNIL